MEEGVLNLFHDSQDDMKKTINWLTAVLFLALPALATLVIVHVIYTLFGHFYNEKETLLYFIVSQLSVLATVFAFRNIQSMAFMNLPKLRCLGDGCDLVYLCLSRSSSAYKEQLCALLKCHVFFGVTNSRGDVFQRMDALLHGV